MSCLWRATSHYGQLGTEPPARTLPLSREETSFAQLGAFVAFVY